MREAGHTVVEVEPKLQKLYGENFKSKSSNKDENARSDISVLVFGAKCDRRFLMSKLYHPLPEVIATCQSLICWKVPKNPNLVNTGKESCRSNTVISILWCLRPRVLWDPSAKLFSTGKRSARDSHSNGLWFPAGFVAASVLLF